jgi:hypothetical protein
VSCIASSTNQIKLVDDKLCAGNLLDAARRIPADAGGRARQLLLTTSSDAIQFNGSRVTIALDEVASNICQAISGGLRAMCAETLVRTARLEDMNRLGASDYDVVRSGLMPAGKEGRHSHVVAAAAGAAGGPSGSSSAAAAAPEDVDEPYEFDVFLCLITAVERRGDERKLVGLHSRD